MPYPAIYTRLFNFQRDANNGLPSPAPSKVDAELNSLQLSLAQANTSLRGITTADGRLRNVAQAIAASLVGTSSVVSGGTTTLVTTVPWASAFSVNSVLVMQGTTLLRPAQLTSVQDNGLGFLQVNLAVAPAAGTLMVVWAFEPGAGLLTRLASTASSDGASIIGIHDAGNFYGSTTVEGALSEIAGSFLSLQQALGDLADVFKRDGSVVATGNFDLGGFKITNAADGVDLGDYVTLRQIANYIAAWSDLSRFYLKRDGTAAMAGAMNFGNNKGYNLADPDLDAPLDAVNVRSMLRTVATSGASPVGTCVDFIGEVPPPNWLMCDGAAYLGTVYPILYGLLGNAFKTGPAQGCSPARFPTLIGGATPGDISGGAIVTGNMTAKLTNAGQGYLTSGVTITCVNPIGSPAPGAQPTFTVTVSPVGTLDGPNVVSGGVITNVTCTGGGVGVLAGARLVISPTFTLLPVGYFKTPDTRGRVIVGTGTESKSTGIVNPPDVAAGDLYNAIPRALGDYGGEQEHQLIAVESPRHTHQLWIGAYGGNPASIATDEGSNGTAHVPLTPPSFGGDLPHNNVQPFVVLNKIIKAA